MASSQDKTTDGDVHERDRVVAHDDFLRRRDEKLRKQALQEILAEAKELDWNDKE